MSETYIFGNVGQTNAQIGTNTMLNTTGAGNSAFGNNVYTYLTSGVNNSGFGVEIASGPSFNGSNNTTYGVEVMKDATSASDTSGFGYQALTALTSGNNNTGFGISSGATATTAVNNTIVGANAGIVSPSTTNALVVGVNAVGADTSIVVGANAQCLATAVSSNNIVVGDKAKMGDGSLNSILIGPAGNDGGAGAYGTITDTVAIGPGVLASATALVCDNNLIVGTECAGGVENLSNSVYMGYFAGNAMEGDRNIAFGNQPFSDDGVSYDNIGFGYNTGQQGYGNDNVLTGYSCGNQLRGGAGCTGLGGFCMFQASSFTSTSVTLQSVLESTLTGTGGFLNPITSLATSPFRIQTVIPGATTGVANGTAVDNVSGMYAVFEVQAGAAGAVSEFIISTSNTATTVFLDGKYFLISSSTVDYYVWFNVDNLTPDPAVVGKTGIEVNLVSGDNPNTINFNAYNAIRNVGGFKTTFTNPSAGTQGFLLVNTGVGDVIDIAPGTAEGFGKISKIAKIRDGSGSEGELNYINATLTDLASITGTYFLISSATTDYYVWFNDGFQIDPMIVGRTGLEVSYNRGDYNTASGWSAMRADTTSGGNPQYIRESTAFGYRAMEELNTGSHYNTIIGSFSVLTNTTIDTSVTLGNQANITGTTQAVSIGASSSATGTTIGRLASSASLNSLALGADAVAAANVYQIGENVVSGTATMNFRTQLVADEAWIGGGTSSVLIDNNGNVVRGTDSLLTFSTTDATPTTMETYIMADNTTREVEALVMGTRTGGIVGSTAQTYSVRLDVAIKRTGGLVTVNKVTEVHLQDMINIGTITNLVSGYAVNINGGTAVTAGGLSSVTTTTDGRQASLSETTYIDFYSFNNSTGFYPYYILFSSTTTDYYIWFDLVGFSPDPMIPGRTGFVVTLNFGQSFAKLMQDVRDIIYNIGGAGVTFDAQFLTSTVVEIAYKTNNTNVTNIDAGTAGAGTVGSLSAVYTTVPGGSRPERAIIDTYGATPAGLNGRWFLLYGAFVSYYVWYRVDGLTTDPGPAGSNNPYLAGKSGLVIDIVTGDTDLIIATKSRAVLDLSAEFNATGSAVIITNNVTGTPVLPLSYSTSFGNNHFISRVRYVETYVTGSPGVAQVIDMSFANQTTTTMRPSNSFFPCAYFKISTTTTSYYFWYSSPGYTIDPTPGGIGVQIMLTAFENEVTIAAKTIAAVNSTGVFTSTGMPEHVTVHNIATGPSLNPPGGTAVIPGSQLYSINAVRNGTTAAVAEISLFDASGATPATLGGKYFIISSTTTTYYIWYNTDGGSVDPFLGGTSVVVAIVTGDTVTDIINKTAAAISAIGGGAVFTAAAASQWSIDVVASGTDAILQVTGSLATDVTWKAYTRNFAV